MKNLFVLFIVVVLLCLIRVGDSLKSPNLDEMAFCLDYIPKSIQSELKLFQPDYNLSDQVIQTIPIDSDKHHKYSKNEKLYYLLHHLRPNTQYAIRISYSASSPTDFRIKFFDNDLITNDIIKSYEERFLGNKASAGKRDLLNTEIIKFKTDESGYVLENYKDKIKKNPCSIITIDAVNVGISPSFVTNDDKKVHSFDLIMDTELIGAPPEIPKLVLIIIVTIVFVFYIVVKRLFPKIKGLQLLI
ncbi:hypothetical protein CYY_009408 [Polysphondylium violaceum]|uniref:Uncharacterized protein n=1 Tax=Polysphondylium violaceum TaxID=133409 RepID=A0A8J4V0I9_9MYCE|nr:hypothetical protein CYY_009408 [Polysphondylium violaceum]